MGRRQISKHRLGKPGADHRQPDIGFLVEAVPHQAAVLIAVDEVFPIDHSPKKGPAFNATLPDLAIAKACLAKLASVDRRDPDALLAYADRVPVDHPDSARPDCRIGRGCADADAQLSRPQPPMPLGTSIQRLRHVARQEPEH